MSNRRTFVAAALAVAYSMVSLPARAYVLPVIDFTNLSQNFITAIEQTADTVIQGKQLIEDIKQTMNDFPIVEQLSKSKELAELMQMIKSAEKLGGALRSAKATHDNFGSAFAISPYTNWKDFLSDIERRKSAGDDSAKSLYDSAKLAEDQVSKAYDSHMAIMTKMPIIEGVTQAAQATANSVGVLIQQQQAVLAMMSASTRDQGKERQREYDERAKLEKAYKQSSEAASKNYQGDIKIFKSLRP